MQITIPPIVRSVHLADYAEELSPGVVQVWVNPTRAVLNAYTELYQRKEQVEAALKSVTEGEDETIRDLVGEMSKIGDGFAEWYSQIWSQHTDSETHITPDGVRQLSTLETDPAFYQWLTNRTWALITDHRSAAKKK